MVVLWNIAQNKLYMKPFPIEATLCGLLPGGDPFYTYSIQSSPNKEAIKGAGA